MSNKIEIGDTVKVFFNTHPAFTGIVHYIPQATGDAWHIEETDSSVRSMVYVQQYDYIIKN